MMEPSVFVALKKYAREPCIKTPLDCYLIDIQKWSRDTINSHDNALNSSTIDIYLLFDWYDSMHNFTKESIQPQLCVTKAESPGKKYGANKKRENHNT